MRILCVMIPTGTPDSPFGDWVRDYYAPMTTKNFDLVRSPDTEIVYRFATWGMNPVEMAFYRYMDHLASSMVFQAAQHAEEEGFDAVIINCFGDPMLYELRQALSIPVIGIGEATFIQTTTMCWKYGIVHVSPYNIPETTEHIEKYGVAGKLLGMRPVHGWEKGNMEEGANAAEQDCRNFIATARELISDGADAIIPACSIMSPIVRLAYGAESAFPGGITEVDGVPVIDVLSVSLGVAESMARLRNAGSSWISRHSMYAQPSAEIREKAKPITENKGFEFWDVEA